MWPPSSGVPHLPRLHTALRPCDAGCHNSRRPVIVGPVWVHGAEEGRHFLSLATSRQLSLVPAQVALEIRLSTLTPIAVSLGCYRPCLQKHRRQCWQARPLADHSISPSLSIPVQFLLGLKQRPPSSLQSLVRPALASTNRNRLHFTSDVQTQHFDCLDASSCRRLRRIATSASSSLELLCGSCQHDRRGSQALTWFSLFLLRNTAEPLSLTDETSVPKRSFQLQLGALSLVRPRQQERLASSLTAVLP